MRGATTSPISAVAGVLLLVAGLSGCDRMDCEFRNGALADTIRRDEGAINVLQDVAFWLSQCGAHCDIQSAKAALGQKYKTYVLADGSTLDVAIPGGLGVISMAYDRNARITSVRREPHILGAPQTGAKFQGVLS